MEYAEGAAGTGHFQQMADPPLNYTAVEPRLNRLRFQPGGKQLLHDQRSSETWRRGNDYRDPDGDRQRPLRLPDSKPAGVRPSSLLRRGGRRWFAFSHRFQRQYRNLQLAIKRPRRVQRQRQPVLFGNASLCGLHEIAIEPDARLRRLRNFHGVGIDRNHDELRNHKAIQPRFGGISLLTLPLIFWLRSRKRALHSWLACAPLSVVFLSFGIAGCGGGSSGGGSSGGSGPTTHTYTTVPCTYTLTVDASSGSVHSTQTLTLVVK